MTVISYVISMATTDIALSYNIYRFNEDYIFPTSHFTIP
uniref:Uncharacterized protein n=1 Tax=Rhizophora mucronata TaxID=61149 RepID=A0A2P2QQ24_RHIMU